MPQNATDLNLTAHQLPADIVGPDDLMICGGMTSGHRISPLEFLDPTTRMPVGCSCAGCLNLIAQHERSAQLSLAQRAFDRAATLRHDEHRQENPEEMCRVCGYGGLPHCRQCGRCTNRGATPDNIRRARSEYNAAVLLELRQNGALGPNVRRRVRFCCTCIVCPDCGDTLGAPGSQCRNYHHIGCNCDCMQCPHCGVTLSRRGTQYHPPLVTDQNGQYIRCATCPGMRGCCCRCSACPICADPQGTHARGDMGDLIENRCQNCGRCIKCCACVPAANTRTLPCDTGERPVFQRGLFRKWDPSSSWGLLPAGLAADKQKNPFKRYIGLEIECASGGSVWLNHVVVRTWGGNIVSDGSLPYKTGFEINTAPAAGDMYVKQVHEICKELARTNVLANGQCGLHVHVDCSDFNIWDMRRLINLYRRLEGGMFALLPDSRQNNHYCAPCGESWWEVFNDPHKTRELKGRLSSALYGVDVSRLKEDQGGDKKKIRAKMEQIKRSRSGKGNALRYRALNVHSWFLRGTLEFRMGAVVWLPGSTPREDDIRNWGLVCCSVVDAARRLSDADVSKVPTSYSSLYNLAPTPDVKKWMTETLKKMETSRAAPRPTNGVGPDEILAYGDDCPCGDGCDAGQCRDCRDNGRYYYSTEQQRLRNEE